MYTTCPYCIVVARRARAIFAQEVPQNAIVYVIRRSCAICGVAYFLAVEVKQNDTNSDK